MHQSVNREVYFQSSNGKEVTLLQCFDSSIKNNGMVLAKRTCLVEQLVSVLAGNKLRETDVMIASGYN